MRKSKQRSTEIHVEGLWELQKTLTKMGKEASDHVRIASAELADDFLIDVRMAASTEAERAAARILRVYRDRIPKVGFPARAKVYVSGRPMVSEFFYGVEFGGPAPFPRQYGGGDRFREHTGITGYFFYPTLRRKGPGLAEEWFDMIEGVMEREWNKGAAAAQAGAN